MVDQCTDNGRFARGFRSAVGTDIGHRRAVNEDSYLAEFPVFVVADGMGGHRGGEVASAIAVQSLQPLVGRSDVTPQEVATLLGIAQQRVSAFSDTVQGGSGTTLSGVVVVRGNAHAPDPYPEGSPAHAPAGGSVCGNEPLQWLVLNIGDSRTYRIRGGQALQLTVDHSEVQELIDSRTIPRDITTREKGVVLRERNVLTRALGDGSSVTDLWTMPIVAGDRMLVVSDGAFADVSEADFLRVAAHPRFNTQSASDSVWRVIEQALNAGGTDNVTVVVVEVPTWVMARRISSGQPASVIQGRTDRVFPPLASLTREPPSDTTAPSSRNVRNRRQSRSQ